ncbi:MAG TPA: MFS transporter [Beijerinckiaceae bacterium]
MISPLSSAAPVSPAPSRAVVPAVGLVQILNWGTTVYLPTVLAPPIAAETGWSLAFTVGGLSVGHLCAGAASPFVGRAVDRLGGRPVLALASGLIAAGLGLLSVAAEPVLYLLAWVVMGLGMGCGLYDAAFATLGELYGAQARRPIGLVTLFGGLASTVSWPLSALLVDVMGWRGACLAYAAAHILLAVPLVLLALPRATAVRPSTTPDGEAEAPAPPRARLLMLGAAICIGAAVTSLIAVHLLTLLRAGGLTAAAAVGLGALVGPSQVGARIVETVFGARYHPLWAMLASAGLAGTGLVLLNLGGPLAFAAIVLYGAGNGIWSITRGTVPLALFGPRRYARIVGGLALPALLASAAAPPLGAWVIETFGTGMTLAGLCAASGLQLGLVALLMRSALGRR